MGTWVEQLQKGIELIGEQPSILGHLTWLGIRVQLFWGLVFFGLLVLLKPLFKKRIAATPIKLQQVEKGNSILSRMRKYYGQNDFRAAGVFLIILGIILAPYLFLFLAFGGSLIGLLWLVPIIIGIGLLSKSLWAFYATIILTTIIILMLCLWFLEYYMLDDFKIFSGILSFLFQSKYLNILYY